jgi:hypothetical protein
VAAMADSRARDRRSNYLVRSVCGCHGRLQGTGQKVNLPCQECLWPPWQTPEHGTENQSTLSGVSVAAMADSRARDRRSIYLVRSVCGRHGRLQGTEQKVNLPCQECLWPPWQTPGHGTEGQSACRASLSSPLPAFQRLPPRSEILCISTNILKYLCR